MMWNVISLRNFSLNVCLLLQLTLLFILAHFKTSVRQNTFRAWLRYKCHIKGPSESRVFLPDFLQSIYSKMCRLVHILRTPMPQVLSFPVIGGSGAPCEGPEDAGGGWDVAGHEKPAGPHPEEELLRWWPAVFCGDPSQRDRDIQESQLRAVFRRCASKFTVGLIWHVGMDVCKIH